MPAAQQEPDSFDEEDALFSGVDLDSISQDQSLDRSLQPEAPPHASQHSFNGSDDDLFAAASEFVEAPQPPSPADHDDAASTSVSPSPAVHVVTALDIIASTPKSLSAPECALAFARIALSACRHGAMTAPPPTAQDLLTLRKVFGHETFKPMQWEIIHSVMHQQRDNLCVVATGYGKSLCYQFPAVCEQGVVLVVSPLISLMEDQVLSLRFARCLPLHGQFVQRVRHIRVRARSRPQPRVRQRGGPAAPQHRVHDTRVH